MKDTEVAKLFKKQRDISKRGLSKQYENTDMCQEAYDADVVDYQDDIQFQDETGRKRKATVNFSKIQPSVDGIVGFFAQNRRQAKFFARVDANQSQELYSKNMNALFGFHREAANADQLETDQDADMMVVGYGAIDTDLSYIIGNATKDPNGQIVKLKLGTKTTYWDPSCTKKNLIGSRWTGYWQDYDLEDALDLFQDSVEDDFEQVVATDSDDDDGYTYNPWGGVYDKIKELNTVEWTSKEQNLVRVYNHQWMKYETFYKAYNPLYLTTDPLDALQMKARMDVIKSEIETNGPDDIEVTDAFEFDPKAEELTFDEATKKILVKEFGKMIKPVPFKREVYYTAIISGSHVFKWFKSISQQGYSIKFKTGIYSETGKFWRGVVNSMIEPTLYYNKALTELMFTIAANSKGGVMVEEDAVEDIADFEDKWAKTDAVILVASGAISGQKIMQKTQGALPTGLENIITLSEQNITQSGVDPAFLGDAQQEDQSGIFYKRRIRQIVSKFARYTDSISLFQKEDAKLYADLIPIWVDNNNGQWVRITGDQGADEFTQITKDMLAPSYDVSIQEAAQTPEDKQQTAALLGTYADKLGAIGNPAAATFYAKSVKMLPLDGDDKNDLIQSLQPQAPQIDPAMVQQLQQRIQELEGQANQAMVAKTTSEAALNHAKAKQTEVNNALIQAKIPQTNASTVKTLQEANRTHIETEQAKNAPPENVNVSV